MQSLTSKQLQEAMLKALKPCLADPPTAAAILVITSDAGVRHYSLNMEPLEVVHTLLAAGMYINESMSPHKTPEILQ